MSKLHLNLNDLDVQTFHTTPAPSGKGTVVGAQQTGQWNESCGLTYCGTCDPTNPDVDCGGGDSADCPSVNVANCPSVYYTDCGCGGGGDRTSWGWDRDEDPDCT